LHTVQLQHHADNWSSLPDSITKRLDALVRDIHPPMSDDTFRSALKQAATEFGQRLVQLTQEHICNKMDEVLSSLGHNNGDNLQKAVEVATTFAHGRYSKSKPEVLEKLMDPGFKKVGTLRVRPAPIVVVPRVTNVRRRSSSAPPTPDSGVQALVPGKKRKIGNDTPTQEMDTSHFSDIEPADVCRDYTVADCATPPQVRQVTPVPFPVLIDATPAVPVPTTVDSNAVRPDTASVPDTDSDTSVIGPSQLPTAVSAHADTHSKLHHYESVRDRVLVFSGEKEDWYIPHLEPNTVVVLADSNLKGATRVPTGLTVVCMPGAHLEHATAAIRAYKSPKPGLKLNLVVQVGINQRFNSFEFNQRLVDELHQAITANPSIGGVRILEVSYPLSMPIDRKMNLDSLSEICTLSFGQDRVIRQLPMLDVKIVAHDEYGIHHTAETANQILTTVWTAVSSDFPRPAAV
jgi:hypothetical protein